jgi:hypothetical protein
LHYPSPRLVPRRQQARPLSSPIGNSFDTFRYVLALSLLAFTLCGRSASAQAQAGPKKKDSVVLIQTPDSAVTALRKLGQASVAQGYTIEELDKEFLTLTVAPKVLAVKASPRLSARASATEGASSTLRVTGDFSASIAGRPFGGPCLLAGLLLAD